MFDWQAPTKTTALPNAIIGVGHPTYVIAEIGGNFTTFAQGKALMEAAVEAGADAVKIQTYKAATVSSKKAVFSAEGMAFTGDVSQYDMFVKYQIDDMVQEEIFQYARDRGVLLFSTPGHQTDVDMLEKLGNPVYKVGSDDAVNLPLLRYIARLQKPILLSTGMCTLQEVRMAVDVIFDSGNDQLVLLHCVTNYPAEPESINLRVIPALHREFGLPIGYSDHVLGNEIALAAAAMGACVIEKHFTLDKNAEGPDHALSATPNELKALVGGVRALEAARGDGIKRPAPTERMTRLNNRKSIVAVRDIGAGERIEAGMIDIKRPGYGIAPCHWETVVGKIARERIPQDEILTWDMVL
ncbi:MAG: N-acetylneuraminate synthase family protein [Deltaproteobacteria bacterium]|nr:N-acetylneuraminate synthase family protein [Deltaproteobacteria bacterium]